MQTLKDQMNILMSHLKQNNIITEEMVRRTTQRQMEHILPSRIKVVLSFLVSILFVPGMTIYEYFNGQISSLPFTLFTVVMCWYAGSRIFTSNHNDIRRLYKEGSLTQVAESVVRMRRQNFIDGLLTMGFLLVWCGWFLYLNYTDLLNEHNGLFFCGIIFLFVTVSIVLGYNRLRRVTGDVLKQIEELQNPDVNQK